MKRGQRLRPGDFESCVALNKWGDPCWRPAQREDLIPGIPLCWSHTAKVLMEAGGAIGRRRAVVAGDRARVLRIVNGE